MGQLIKHVGSSGVELDGYVASASATGAEPGSRGVVIHVHGLAGNFYENPFVHEFARTLPEHGITFVAVNTRAHDYLADAVTADGDYLERGAAHTPLDQTVDDLATWIEYVRQNFDGPVVVQTHSAGAATALAAVEHRRAVVDGLVLLAPADMLHEIRTEHSPDELERLRHEAEQRLADGNGDQLMPGDAIDGYPIAADVFAEMSDPDSDWGLYSFEHPERLAKTIGELATLAVYGSDDPTAPAPVGKSLAELVSEVNAHGAHVGSAIVDGAGHSFRGFEARLVDVVVEWLSPVLDAARAAAARS